MNIELSTGRWERLFTKPFVAHLNYEAGTRVKKFSSYADSRRVLLLSSHGDLEDESVDWWRALLVYHPAPSEVDEIWLAQFEWVDYNSQDWFFQRVHPAK